MICARCAHAADRQLGEDEHCADQPGSGSACDCQHRTERYRRPAATGPEATVVIHIHPDPPHVAAAIRDIRRHGPGR